MPIVGAISAQEPQGAGPLWRGIASACVVYLRLIIQAYGSAHGRRRSAPALPVLRLADAVQAPTFKRRFGFRLSQLFGARGDFRARLASARAGLTILQFASGSLWQ